MQNKDYYVPVIHSFEFIDTEDQARKAIKTVLGLVADSVTEKTAKEFVAQLPGWLHDESLRGGQPERTARKPEDCTAILKDMYGFDDTQANVLMHKVIAITARKSTGNLSDLILELPDGWDEIFDQSPKQEKKDRPVI